MFLIRRKKDNFQIIIDTSIVRYKSAKLVQSFLLQNHYIPRPVVQLSLTFKLCAKHTVVIILWS
jgi:hypothetical protein